MSSIIARNLRLIQASSFVRTLHVSSTLLIGRKMRRVKIGNSLQRYSPEVRREHARLYEELDTVFEEDDLEGNEDEDNNAELDPNGKANPNGKAKPIEEEEPDEIEGLSDDHSYGFQQIADDNDHHTHAHLLINSIDDVKKYTRQMYVEFPMLAQHASPFNPPPENKFLHFERSVTIGDKHLSEDRKVLLRLQVSKLGLKGAELRKFLLLVGDRYNPEIDELKMSENRESSSLMNKKVLGDTLIALITEAKKTDDQFADVPLDFSSRGYKPAPVFPTEWLPKLKEKREVKKQRKAKKESKAKNTKAKRRAPKSISPQ
ncbi:37S ribosomal protein S24, mitochondrial [Coemansia sp. RSA 1972]|nr:37S ribosomal protein S24, mitochondrial [Coemansia sp. RSA 1972]